MADLRSCPICRAAASELVYDLTMANGAEEIPGLVIRCRQCGMWFKSTLHAIPTDYPFEHGDDPLAAEYLGGSAARALFQEILAAVRPADGGRHLLDIGCGSGVLLEEARRLGFVAHGLDHSAVNVAAARAKGFAVQHAAAETLEAEQAYDVVTMLDIVEHLADPVDVLRRAARALVPGGALVVYTPNHRAVIVALARVLHALRVRYPVREIFGRNHVAFFDDRTLPEALRRAGLEVGPVRFTRYDTARPGQEVSALDMLAVTAAEWAGKPFDRVFRMLAYARRPVS